MSPYPSPAATRGDRERLPTTISAWAADGVAAQTSGGRGCSVRSMDQGIRRRYPWRKLLAQGGPERLQMIHVHIRSLGLLALLAPATVLAWQVSSSGVDAQVPPAAPCVLFPGAAQ